MKLDYNPATNDFILRVPRKGGADIQDLIRNHGFDFSLPASTDNEAVLFTKEPYCAATFWEYTTERAKQQLGVIYAEIEASWKKESSGHFRCPPDKELWPFQKADLEYALRRRNTLIGDQPGLGKTPIAICYANEIAAKRVLVICPASIRIQWMNKIREWSTMSYPMIAHPILHGRHGVNPDANWTVVSYELARSEAIGKALAKGTYDLLILDEAHYLKTIDSRRTRAVFGGGEKRTFEPIAPRAENILALTGTPLPNRPREAYTLARGLCFDSIDWVSEDQFNSRFNPSIRGERVDPISGRTIIFNDERTGRHSELQNRLRSNFMVRHLKREVMPQLKMPIYDIIQLEETGPVKQALEAERLLDIDPEQLEGADMTALGHIAVVRRMMGIALAPQIAQYVDMVIDGGEEKLVLFCWHIEVANMLEKALHKRGVIRVSSVADKFNKVQQFIKDPNKHIILGNTLTLGTGTDGLQEVCSHAILAEPSWTPGDNEQAFDRLDRGGQRRTVQGDIMVAPGSFAEKILASSLRKSRILDRALDRKV
jgi:SWI/SNF-related matrix-associated actin-dependent regulator 1 of chromatin subfamily A